MAKLSIDSVLKIISSSKKSINKSKNDSHTFEWLDDYKEIQFMREGARLLKVQDPFFKILEGVPSSTCLIAGKTLVNFSSYNYLNLNGDVRVSQAAKEAIDRYGTSASASRIVSGERPIHQLLENALAQLHGTEQALAFVSGHATNVTTIGYLFGPEDLIIHDEYIHNSAIEGIKLSGAKKCSFPHNDWKALESSLELRRQQHKRVLIILEGHYSMDGDYPDLPEFIRIKKKHNALLMIDEAHSIGVLGKDGKGIQSLFDINTTDVDIWMGTFSKTLAACGGYIAGNTALVETLSYKVPGFLYSTGIVPPMASAALEALNIMEQEPQRIESLHARAQQFLKEAQRAGLDTGLSKGLGIIPIICGSSRKAANLSNQLFKKNINVQPIIFPAVPEKQARLRFFINSAHTEDQISTAIKEISSLM